MPGAYRERSSAKPGRARLRGEDQNCVVRNFGSDIAERHAGDCTRDAADVLAVQLQLVSRCGVSLDVEHAQPSVHLASVALPCDRLLPRVAPLAEADVRLVQAGLRREDALVDLVAPARDARLDPPAFELVLADLFARRTLVEQLGAAQHEPRLVFL